MEASACISRQYNLGDRHNSSHNPGKVLLYSSRAPTALLISYSLQTGGGWVPCLWR